MKLNPVSVFVAGALTTVVVGGGSAYAATGGTFVLGRANAATATSTLSNSAGVPLKLNARAGSAPLAVNSTTTVKNLSADKVDGIDSSALALTKGRTGIIYGSASDADGQEATAQCPRGSVATGGGGIAANAGHLSYSGPAFDKSGTLVPNSWLALDLSGEPTLGWVSCYNPRGAVAGAATTLFGEATGSRPATSLGKALAKQFPAARAR